MLLALDIGNSQVTIGAFQGESPARTWRLPTDRRRTEDEYGLLIEGLIQGAGLGTRTVDDVVICSVVPPLTDVFDSLSRSVFGRRPLIVGAGTRTGMAVRYRPPGALGADRLVDALAARERFGAPVIVVDLGTATTFNVVTPDGAFGGGAIAPGVGVMADTLVEHGARLSAVGLSRDPPPAVVGRTTEQSVRSGVLHGQASLISGLVGRLADHISASDGVTDSEVPVVATGGWCRVIAPLVPRVNHIVPELLLDGLRLVHQRTART